MKSPIQQDRSGHDVFEIVKRDAGRGKTGNYSNRLELPLMYDKTAFSDCSETFATFLEGNTSGFFSL